MSNKSKMVCVVGGGVIGMSTALALHEQGFAVTLIDANEHLADGASGQNGAQLSYSYVDALGSGALLKQLPKLALGLDPSFNISLSTSVKQKQWLFSFLRNCTDLAFERNTLSLLGLGALSQTTLKDWRTKYQFKFDFSKAGKLLLCSPAMLAKHTKNRALKEQFGIRQQILSKAETLDLEPFLQNANNTFSGAIYASDDAVGDPKLFVRETAKYLEENSSFSVYLNERVEVVHSRNGYVTSLQTDRQKVEADAFVFCAGTQTADLAMQWEERVPIVPMVGYSLNIKNTTDAPKISITDTVSKTVVCQVGENIRFAGLADLGFNPNAPRQKREELLKQTFLDLYGAATQIDEPGDVWVGARPMTPNSCPIIRPAKLSNAFLNCGHGMFGWTLAAGSGLVSARQVQEFLVSA